MTIKVSLRLPRELLARLDDAAAGLGLTRNAVIMLAVRRFLVELASGKMFKLDE